MKKDVFTLLSGRGLSNDGWFFSAELLVRAEWNNVALTEIPVQWEDDRNSKVRIISVSYNYLCEIWKMYKEKKGRTRS